MKKDEEEIEPNFQTKIPDNIEESEKEIFLEELKKKFEQEKETEEFCSALALSKKFIAHYPEKKFVISVDFSKQTEFKFNKIIEELSFPKFILYLSINKEFFIKRYKKINKLDDIEKDELPKLYNAFDSSQETKEYLIKEIKKMDFINFFEFNNMVSLKKAKENLVATFKKDFILILDRLPDCEQDPEKSSSMI